MIGFLLGFDFIYVLTIIFCADVLPTNLSVKWKTWYYAGNIWTLLHNSKLGCSQVYNTFASDYDTHYTKCLCKKDYKL